jgi:hypothetical protein
MTLLVAAKVIAGDRWMGMEDHTAGENCVIFGGGEPCSNATLFTTNPTDGILMGEYRSTGRSHFMPGIRSWKVSHKSNTEFPFKTMYFLGVKGMTTSSYIVYDYTISGHTDL